MTAFRQAAVLVEGQTEAAFVDQILVPAMAEHQLYLKAVIVKTSRTAGGTASRGGGSTWKHYEADLRNLLGSRQFNWVTTLIDFYDYPRDAPGLAVLHRYT